jgi:uncharacterized membrane protein YjgN (DUF898 family)
METLSSADGPAPPQKFEFTGTGDEYFRIWIVNVVLSILTLGIYSAWAKVRKLQYFYQHTRVADSGFDYHGKPFAILKGRLVALGLLALYVYSTEVISAMSAVILLAIGVVLPWLLRGSLRFRAHNSSWRGLRFSFHGSLKGSYFVFLWLGGLGFITGLLWPLFHSRLKRYQHGNAFFGQTKASFTAGDGEFYGVYVKASLLSIAVVVVTLVLMMGPLQALRAALIDGSADPETVKRAASMFGLALVVVMFVGMSILVGPYVAARIQNLVWNHTRLGDHRFESTVSARRLTWIYVSNFLAVIATLGFFMPWAAVRVARYRAGCLALLPAGSLDEFVAAQAADVAAVGEETAEMFDIDIAL